MGILNWGVNFYIYYYKSSNFLLILLESFAILFIRRKYNEITKD